MRRRGEAVVAPRAAWVGHRGQLEKLLPPDSVTGPLCQLPGCRGWGLSLGSAACSYSTSSAFQSPSATKMCSEERMLVIYTLI